MRNPTCILAAPAFRRFDDYLGCWAYEPERFVAQWDLIQRTDLARHAAESQPKPLAATESVAVGDGRTISVIKATGTLMKQASSFGGTSTVQLRREIRAAANDPNVSAILLAIDSPGGTVSGTADLGAEVKAARRRKPVWAHIDDLGASAAYWVASQADMVFANAPTALVGSIGTVMTVYDLSASAEREGVRALVFATGPLKGAGTPGSAVTAEQRDYFQRIVDDAQASFDDAVKSGRGMTAQQLAAVRTGGVFSAPEARRLKLIDGIRPLDATLKALATAK